MPKMIPSQCTFEIPGDRVTLKDRGTSANLHIKLPPGKHVKIQVDGCIDAITTARCDWCLRLDGGGHAFFELKGSDYCHALEQLSNTISWFQTELGRAFVLHSAHVVISGQGTPNLNTRKQRAKTRFLKCHSLIPNEHRSGKEIAL